ncbi:MAG TPA: hypothetical protein VGE80_20680 [Schlesneria sp.]
MYRSRKKLAKADPGRISLAMSVDSLITRLGESCASAEKVRLALPFVFQGSLRGRAPSPRSRDCPTGAMYETLTAAPCNAEYVGAGGNRPVARDGGFPLRLPRTASLPLCIRSRKLA